VRHVLVATAVALALAATALAGDGKEQIKLNARDQALARSIVIRRADVGTAPGWSGGMKKPDLSGGLSCANYHPEQSDLVVTGTAESEFHNVRGLLLDSEAQVLRTARMVRLDWERSVIAPGAVPCLRQTIVKSIGSGGKLVSFRKLAFPRIGDVRAAFLLMLDVKAQGTSVRVMVEPVLVGTGRVEITLMGAAPAGAEKSVTAAQVRLARILVARAG
jgi:hypothetical protein